MPSIGSVEPKGPEEAAQEKYDDIVVIIGANQQFQVIIQEQLGLSQN